MLDRQFTLSCEKPTSNIVQTNVQSAAVSPLARNSPQPTFSKPNANALKLKKDFQKAGFTLLGEYEPTQSLYFSFPGGVRLEVGSALSATYPKPGKPKYESAAILDDLRRRDFTVNALAIRGGAGCSTHSAGRAT